MNIDALRAFNIAAMFIGFGIGLLLTGCSSVSYVSPDGATFTRTALGTDADLQGLKFWTGADGSRHLEIDSLNAVQTKAIEAAARGAAAGARGVP